MEVENIAWTTSCVSTRCDGLGWRRIVKLYVR